MLELHRGADQRRTARRRRRSASTRSSRVITVPARLLIFTGDAVADQVDHLPDQHLDGVGVVAERGGGGLEPADVAVVVGAEHVDAQVEAAGPLVLEVGDVTGDVGGVAVALDDHAVLVVAVFGAGEPPGAVLLVQVARSP